VSADGFSVDKEASMRRTTCLSVFLSLAASGWLFAQATAAISGRVVDQDGAMLPGVTVTVTNTATGATRDTMTNGEGLYTVPALPSGMYRVKVELTGFAVRAEQSGADYRLEPDRRHADEYRQPSGKPDRHRAGAAR
jgi:hypothetical protein